MHSQLCEAVVHFYTSVNISVVNSSAVYEAGGHEFLVQQLHDSCPRTVANAAAAIGNMAGQEVIRCSILSCGAIQALVEPLKSTDTQVLVNTTLCLAMLVCDADARAEVGISCSHVFELYILHKRNSSLYHTQHNLLIKKLNNAHSF